MVGVFWGFLVEMLVQDVGKVLVGSDSSCFACRQW